MRHSTLQLSCACNRTSSGTRNWRTDTQRGPSNTYLTFHKSYSHPLLLITSVTQFHHHRHRHTPDFLDTHTPTSLQNLGKDSRSSSRRCRRRTQGHSRWLHLGTLVHPQSVFPIRITVNLRRMSNPQCLARLGAFRPAKDETQIFGNRP